MSVCLCVLVCVGTCVLVCVPVCACVCGYLCAYLCERTWVCAWVCACVCVLAALTALCLPSMPKRRRLSERALNKLCQEGTKAQLQATRWTASNKLLLEVGKEDFESRKERSAWYGVLCASRCRSRANEPALVCARETPPNVVLVKDTPPSDVLMPGQVSESDDGTVPSPSKRCTSTMHTPETKAVQSSVASVARTASTTASTASTIASTIVDTKSPDVVTCATRTTTPSHMTPNSFEPRRAPPKRRLEYTLGRQVTGDELQVRRSKLEPDVIFTEQGKKLGWGLFMPDDRGGWTEDLVVDGAHVRHVRAGDQEAWQTAGDYSMEDLYRPGYARTHAHTLTHTSIYQSHPHT